MFGALTPENPLKMGAQNLLNAAALCKAAAIILAKRESR